MLFMYCESYQKIYQDTHFFSPFFSLIFFLYQTSTCPFVEFQFSALHVVISEIKALDNYYRLQIQPNRPHASSPHFHLGCVIQRARVCLVFFFQLDRLLVVQTVNETDLTSIFSVKLDRCISNLAPVCVLTSSA